MYEDIFLENEKKRGRERERGGVEDFWFLVIFLLLEVILKSHVGEVSIRATPPMEPFPQAIHYAIHPNE